VEFLCQTDPAEEPSHHHAGNRGRPIGEGFARRKVTCVTKSSASQPSIAEWPLDQTLCRLQAPHDDAAWRLVMWEAGRKLPKSTLQPSCAPSAPDHFHNQLVCHTSGECDMAGLPVGSPLRYARADAQERPGSHPGQINMMSPGSSGIHQTALSLADDVILSGCLWSFLWLAERPVLDGSKTPHRTRQRFRHCPSALDGYERRRRRGRLSICRGPNEI